MFLLNAIQQKFCTEDGGDVAFVFFNVKGRDLMAIDEPNSELKEADKKIYTEELGLSTEPFHNVRYFYPFDNQKAENIFTNADPKDVKRQRAEHKAFTYKFPCENYLDKLDLLLANENDSTGTMESCVNYIINGQGNFKNVSTWETLKEVISQYANGSTTGAKNEILPSSWKKFLRIINKAVNTQGIFNDNLADYEKDLTT